MNSDNTKTDNNTLKSCFVSVLAYPCLSVFIRGHFAFLFFRRPFPRIPQQALVNPARGPLRRDLLSARVGLPTPLLAPAHLAGESLGVFRPLLVDGRVAGFRQFAQLG